MGYRVLRSGLVVALVSLGWALGCGPDDTAEHDQQGSVQGHVTLEDAEDYSGVEVVAGDDSATTDADGYYEIHWLPAGDVEVTADHRQYAAETQTVDIEPGEMATADFELQLDDSRPTIEEVYTDPEVLLPDQTVDVIVEVNNPDELEIDYLYEVTGDFDVADAGDGVGELTTPDRFGADAELTVAIEEDGEVIDEETVDIETRTNEDPVIESVSAVPEQLEPGQTGQLEVEATDPDGDELSYQWDAPEGWQLDPADEAQVELTAPEEPNASAMIEVVVDDGLGGEAVDHVEVSTRDNTPPEIVELTAEPPQVEPGGEIQLSVEATDPDGDDIEYFWSAPQDWTLESDDEPQTALIAPNEYENTAMVQLEVIDEHGAVTAAQILVSTITDQGPQLEEVSADPAQIQRGEVSQLKAVATHPEDAELDYEWDAPQDWTLQEDDDEPAESQLVAPHLPGETATVQVTVVDPQDNEAVGSVVVATPENNHPVIESLNADPSSVLPGETTTVSAEASDPDGEELTYDWDTPDGWEGTSSDDELELTAPDDYGESGTVTLTVDDGWDTTSASVSVSTVQPVDPNIISFEADPSVVQREATSTLTVDAEHAYGEPLSYEYSKDNDDWTLDESADTAELTAPDVADDQVVVDVEVTDDYGGSANASVTVQTPQNNPPAISSFEADPTLVEREATSELTVDAEDPDGGDISYEYSKDNDDWTLDQSEDTAQLTAPDAYDDSVTVTVTVEDDYGATTQSSVSVYTEPNVDPVISSFTAEPQMLERGEESELDVEAFDPGGEPVSYSWSIDGDNEDEWGLDEDGDSATVQAPDRPDDELEVTVTVDDGYGGEATESVVLQTESNNPPVIEELEMDSDDPDGEWVARDGDAELFADVTNEDGDDLSWDWSISSGWSIDAGEAEADIEAPSGNDVSGTVELTVSDDWGGEDSDQFQVRTQDTEPDGFGFENEEEVPGDEWVESEQIELQGFDGPVSASCNGCEVSVEGSGFDTDVDDIHPGDVIQIRVMSSGDPGSTVTADVTVGDTTSAEWSVTTREALYVFDSHTFTTCNQIGRYGPERSDCTDDYSPDWTDDTDYFDVDEGIQQWTVPEDGTYRIELAGAQGQGDMGGKGARMAGDFEFVQGEQIHILVGQRGTLADYTADYGGGGGGSFVAEPDDTPLIVAAGGNSGIDDNCGNPGLADEGDGEGGDSQSPGKTGGGGGFYSDGYSTDGSHGRGYVNGGLGGEVHDNDVEGGFGGGGSTGQHGSGAGGGYSGAEGEQHSSYICGDHLDWAKSYNDGADQDNESETNEGEGYVTITRQ